ncbi:MAG: epoxyqueuosine reductase QueH, partial [Armatimonadota bacterium]
YEADFKRDGGFDESVRLSKQLGLYRQDYCGCIFSLQERERRRADRSGSSSSPAS